MKFLTVTVRLFCLAMMLGFFQMIGFARQTTAVWERKTESETVKSGGERAVSPKKFLVYALNRAALDEILADAPLEFSAAARSRETVLELPAPDGSLQRFRIEESPMLEPELAAKFPDIKTYHGQGIDDPTATLRFDVTPLGFHSQILSSNGTLLIDPYALENTGDYLVYFKRDVPQNGNFFCEFGEKIIDNFYQSNLDFLSFPDAPDVTSGATLRTYRTAVAATGEFTAFYGGTVSAGQSAIVTIMNRVNGIYERDLAIRLTLVGNNSSLVYTNASTDPYTNNNPSALLSENQSNLNSVIGSANYDLGHVFSTAGGGLAGLGVVCSGGSKAQGETGTNSPVGDPFAVDYVAHEMGHQFGGNHTFNYTDGNRNASTAYEPGSGITIMAYAGLFGSGDLAAHSIDTFHVKSLEEIIAYKTNANGGGGCGTATTTGNTPPVVTTPNSFNIPRTTPFALTANATDPNGDAVTYDWEEYDLGASTTAVPNTDADGSARPIFRPYLPTSSPTRFFPSLQYILNNANVPPSSTNGFLTGELLPAISRTMVFQVVARDNRANGGGISTATTNVVVNAAAGPFNVTTPNTNVSWVGNSMQTVTWDVANTTAAPISAANVRISLSTDGGQTFPTVLAVSTANDGSEVIVVPNTPTTQARVKVEAVGNIFFDIGNTNFSITAGPTAATVSLSGRVILPNNFSTTGAIITLTAADGTSRTTTTGKFGNFRFRAVEIGKTYILSVSAKRGTFAPMVINPTEDLSGIIFTVQ